MKNISILLICWLILLEKRKMTKEKLMNMVGEFTWNFGQQFFIETSEGNFIWNDPDYNGDNTIRKYNGSLQDYFGKSFGRDKGKHYIKDYCGENFTYIE